MEKWQEQFAISIVLTKHPFAFQLNKTFLWIWTVSRHFKLKLSRNSVWKWWRDKSHWITKITKCSEAALVSLEESFCLQFLCHSHKSRLNSALNAEHETVFFFSKVTKGIIRSETRMCNSCRTWPKMLEGARPHSQKGKFYSAISSLPGIRSKEGK